MSNRLNTVRSGRMQGFTLIELLVVIAIIAILAAILFPVFAQAREKARQTSCLSNEKQIGIGILAYSQDYDELMPIANANLNGTLWNSQLYVWGWPGVSANAKSVWANAMQPYVKSYAVFACPSGIAQGDESLAQSSYTMNGYLGTYPQAQIIAPADVILLWSGHQKTNFSGSVWSSPTLTCDDATVPCVFQPEIVVDPTDSSKNTCASGNGGKGGSPIVFSGYPSYSAWIHGNGDNRMYADGHVKWNPLNGDGNYDPYVTNTSTGSILTGNSYSYYTTRAGCFSYLFRPNFVR